MNKKIMLCTLLLLLSAKSLLFAGKATFYVTSRSGVDKEVKITCGVGEPTGGAMLKGIILKNSAGTISAEMPSLLVDQCEATVGDNKVMFYPTSGTDILYGNITIGSDGKLYNFSSGSRG